MQCYFISVCILIALADRTKAAVIKGDNRIIGGVPTDIDDYSYAAFLEIFHDEKLNFTCSGSTISLRFILTAASCVPHDANGIIAHLGSEDPYESMVVVYGDRWLQHPLYSAYPPNNDIGLILTDRRIALDCTVGYVIRTQKFYSDVVGVFAGWGKEQLDDTESGRHEARFKSVRQYLPSREMCLAVIPDLKEKNICGMWFTGDQPWAGDNGGALIVDGFQVGIFSGSHHPASNFSIYTSVAEYNDWITATQVRMLNYSNEEYVN